MDPAQLREKAERLGERAAVLCHEAAVAWARAAKLHVALDRRARAVRSQPVPTDEAIALGLCTQDEVDEVNRLLADAARLQGEADETRARSRAALHEAGVPDADISALAGGPPVALDEAETRASFSAAGWSDAEIEQLLRDLRAFLSGEDDAR